MSYTFLDGSTGDNHIAIVDIKNISAEELMVSYQQKSPDLAFLAFEELYRRFSSKVFTFLVKKCKDQIEAEDILQKVFIKVHESKHLYIDKYKFEQWIFVIARTSFLDHFRSQKRAILKKEKWKNEMEAEKAYESSSIREQDKDESLKGLDTDQREMLEMKYLDELSYKEMAEVLNKSENSLRKTVSRMMINLRKGEV